MDIFRIVTAMDLAKSIPGSAAERAEEAAAQAQDAAASAVQASGATEIAMTTGYYILTNSDPVNLTPQTSPYGTHTYAILDCNAGDVFRISAHGGVSPYSWCFIDKNNNRVLYN